MLGIFFALLVLVWVAVLLTAFCPLRAARRRRERDEWEKADSTFTL